jgi:ketosteroid isomerase-like protein
LPANLRGAEEALNSFHQALRAGDRKAALALLAQDALIYESGHAEGKTEYAAHHLDADIAFAKEVPGTTVSRHGGSAGTIVWLTTEGRATGNYKGKAVNRQTTETALLRSDAGKWRIVHLHWSSAAAK